MASVLERFEEKFIPEPMSGCWLWLACVSHGYGRFYWPPAKTDINAQRAAWELYVGPIPHEIQVLHKCDTPPCVNPDHLFLGTHLDNIEDRIRKGRDPHVCGVLNGNSKITDEIADFIVSDPRPLREIAAEFGIDKTGVGKIKSGRAWAHATKGKTNPRGMSKGEDRWNAKLSNEEIRKIRADPRMQTLIALDYGLSKSTVCVIKSRKRWAHVI